MALILNQGQFKIRSLKPSWTARTIALLEIFAPASRYSHEPRVFNNRFVLSACYIILLSVLFSVDIDEGHETSSFSWYS